MTENRLRFRLPAEIPFDSTHDRGANVNQCPPPFEPPGKRRLLVAAMAILGLVCAVLPAVAQPAADEKEPPKTYAEKSPEEKLLHSLERKEFKRVRELIAGGVDVNATVDGKHPLTVALDVRNATLFQLLVEAGAVVPQDAVEASAETRNAWFHQTAKWLTADSGDERKVPMEALLQAGVAPPIFPQTQRLLEFLHGNEFELAHALLRQPARYGDALCLAILRQDAELLSDLVERNWPSLPCRRPFDRQVPPLELAASRGESIMVETLLASGVDPNSGQALATMAWSGHLMSEELTYRKGLEDYVREVALSSELMTQHLAVGKALLQGGADPNLALGETELRPLAGAISTRRPELARLLLEAGADPNLPFRAQTALQLAQAADDPDLVSLLRESSPGTPSAESSTTQSPTTQVPTTQASTAPKVPAKELRPWRAGSLRCSTKDATRFLREGGDPSEVFEEGPAVHIVASTCSDFEALDILLEAGAAIDQLDAEGSTVLWRMAQGRRLDKISALLARGASPNVRGPDGTTFLTQRLLDQRSQDRLAELLATPGLDLDFADSDGRSALLLATAEGNSDLFAALLKAGASRNIKDNAGRGLPWYRWQGITRKDTRRLVHTPYFRLDIEVPDGFRSVTSRVKLRLKNQSPEDQASLETLLEVYISQDERPILLGLDFAPGLSSVSAAALETALPEFAWNQEMSLHAGGLAIVGTAESEAQDLQGSYVQSEMYAAVPWSPFPIIAYVFGPQDREAEMSWMLRGFINSFAEPPPRSPSQVVSDFLTTSPRVVRVGLQLLAIAAGFLILLVLVVAGFSSKNSAPTQLAKGIRRVALFFIGYAVAWTLTCLGMLGIQGDLDILTEHPDKLVDLSYFFDTFVLGWSFQGDREVLTIWLVSLVLLVLGVVGVRRWTK